VFLHELVAALPGTTIPAAAGVKENKVDAAHTPLFGELQKATSFKSQLGGIFSSKKTGSEAHRALHELTMLLTCLPVVEHTNHTDLLQNLAESAKGLINHMITQRQRLSGDLEILSRSLLSVSLHTAFKLASQKEEKVLGKSAQCYFEMALDVFTHFPQDSALLQAAGFWLSHLCSSPTLSHTVREKASLEVLATAHLPALIRNLRSNEAPFRLATLEVLRVFARTDETDAKAKALLQVVEIFLEAEKIEVAVDTHRARMMYLRKVLQLSVLPSPWSAVTPAYLFGESAIGISPPFLSHHSPLSGRHAHRELQYNLG